MGDVDQEITGRTSGGTGRYLSVFNELGVKLGESGRVKESRCAVLLR